MWAPKLVLLDMAALPKVPANLSNKFCAIATGLRLCNEISSGIEAVAMSGNGIAAEDAENASAAMERNVDARIMACRCLKVLNAKDSMRKQEQ
jgi:hypothetical protein